ncbi:MAG: MBL fold metallo-hydrolase [Coriobacteriales bacterium]|nr:MBL fold metallo-hydrolase [Coriobacteriales bacterium]
MDTSFITINTHSSIRLEAKQGTVIYVDPYGFETEPHDADLILVTHTHFDHFSPEDIARVRKPRTAFVLPATAMGAFTSAGFTSEDAAFLAPHEHATPLPGVEVEAVPAYNVNKRFHPKDNAWLGYVVGVDGMRVYIAGDTDDLPENREINCDVALIPAGGTYTMNAREAAVFVNALKPSVAIPEHYGTVAGSADDGKTFAGLVDSSIQVVFKL